MFFQYILLSILLICAVAIIVAVTIAKTSEDGLSGTIVGGSDTYYGKDKAAQSGRKLFLFTMIVSIVFAVVVLLVYVIQPDYSAASTDWTKGVTEYSGLFN